MRYERAIVGSERATHERKNCGNINFSQEQLITRTNSISNGKSKYKQALQRKTDNKMNKL